MRPKTSLSRSEFEFFSSGIYATFLQAIGSMPAKTG